MMTVLLIKFTNYGSKSVFKFELNKKLEIINEEMYVINERVRYDLFRTNK